jgi:cell division protein FtsQ
LLALAGAAFLTLDLDKIYTSLPIRYVRVEGELLRLNPNLIKQAIEKHVNKGYLMMNLNEIEFAAKQDPWVDRVKVNRVWPDTLELQVDEQIPVARWSKDSLLNIRGEPFQAMDRHEFTGLPALDGPPGQEKMMLKMIRILDQKLASQNVKVEGLFLSNRRAWTAKLSGGTEIIFGTQDPVSSLERLISLLPRLARNRITSIQKLDLRYPNGFAVVWKPESLTTIQNPIHQLN